jgi:hypothetical protein
MDVPRIEISAPALNEIMQKLVAAGHADCIHDSELHFHDFWIGIDATVKAGTVPVNMLSLLSARTKTGLVQLRLGETVVQMDLDKAREIVTMLQGVIEAAISDQLLFTFLSQNVGLSEDTAGRALLDFRELRQGSRDTVIPN